MAPTTRTDIYRRVRRWVDRDLATQHRPLSIFGPLFLVMFGMVGAYLAGSVAVVIGWSVLVPLYAAWTGFVGWRSVRLIRAASIRGDRDYDQRGKYLLATEYHRSESVLATSRRKRREARP